MINWIKKQLTEPTAWLCSAIIVAAILTRTDTFVIWIAIIGIMLDEDAFKAWCAKVAPSLSEKLDDWAK